MPTRDDEGMPDAYGIDVEERAGVLVLVQQPCG